MNVIAKKREGIGAMYGILSFIGFVLIGAGLASYDKFIYFGIIGIILAVWSGYIFIDYMRLPSNVILIDNNGIIHLPKNTTLSPKDIIDVSYRRASARGIQYKWGSVTVKTHLDSYKYGYIADCEEVSKTLLKIMHEGKGENKS